MSIKLCVGTHTYTVGGVATDFEGTLVDLEKIHFDAFSEAMEELGLVINASTILNIPGAIGGGDQFIARKLHETSQGKISEETILNRKREIFSNTLKTTEITPRLGSLRTLQRIKGLGLPLVLTSLTEKEQGELLLKSSSLDGLFLDDHILWADSVEHKKPAPDIFLKAAELMRISPEHMLVFGDSTNDVLAAKAAGCKQIVGMPIFRRTTGALLESGASQVYLDWEQIALTKVTSELVS